MRLQVKPKRWMCLVTSFAMALDIPVSEAIERLGHDGSRRLWPHLPEPLCRRGFHPQELIDLCRFYGYAVTRVELCPRIAPAQDEQPVPILDDAHAWSRFEDILQTSFGVIEGVGRECGHAVAYDRGHIFDPDGRNYAYLRIGCEARGFYVRHLWRLDPIGAVA